MVSDLNHSGTTFIFSISSATSVSKNATKSQHVYIVLYSMCVIFNGGHMGKIGNIWEKLGTCGKLMINTPMMGIRMIYQHNIMGKWWSRIKNQNLTLYPICKENKMELNNLFSPDQSCHRQGMSSKCRWWMEPYNEIAIDSTKTLPNHSNIDQKVSRSDQTRRQGHRNSSPIPLIVSKLPSNKPEGETRVLSFPFKIKSGRKNMANDPMPISEALQTVNLLPRLH